VIATRWARVALVLAVASLGLVACGQPVEQEEPDLQTPGGTVEHFFRLLSAGNQPDVLALCTDQARRALEDPEVFRSWAEEITRHGTIARVRVIDSTDDPDGGTATVDFEVAYDSGAVNRRTVALERDGEGWRLGVIL